MPHCRIGHGYDIHRFGGDKPLVLGGVAIPYHEGLIAHSDGDVVLHALCDALLGAAGFGDIGQHFPDHDVTWKNASSRGFLRTVYQKLADARWSISNADITILAEAPKIMPHALMMRQHIAEDLRVQPEQINIKATTHEGLGAIGRKQGIAVHAVALLQSI